MQLNFPQGLKPFITFLLYRDFVVKSISLLSGCKITNNISNSQNFLLLFYTNFPKWYNKASLCIIFVWSNDAFLHISYIIVYFYAACRLVMCISGIDVFFAILKFLIGIRANADDIFLFCKLLRDNFPRTFPFMVIVE